MLDQIRAIAIEAGRRMMTFYDGEMGVTYKEDDSPLTLADKASHDCIMQGLAAAFPKIPVISEEGVVPKYEDRKDLEQFWLVDPLDGTKEFIKKNGEFTVNIALIKANRPILGVVYIPAQQKLYFAAKGQGAWLSVNGSEPERLYAKDHFNPECMTVSVSRSHPSGALDVFLKKLNGIQLKGLGSSLKFCFIAEKQVDFYPRFGPLMEWDTGAAHIVAEESGAIVTSLDGKPLTYNKPIMKHSEGFIAASCQSLSDYLFERV